MTTLAVIPARYGSTRLPGKALLEIGHRRSIRNAQVVLSAERSTGNRSHERFC